MKKILLGFIGVAFVIATYAFTTVPTNEGTPETETGKRVKWMTWDEAVKAANAAKAAGEEPRKIFVDIYTNWCGWCRKMDEGTFEEPKIAKYLNENFYPVKFNAEQRESITFAGKTFNFIGQGRRGYHELAAALLDGKMSYPTVIFLNEEFQLLQRIPGYLDINTFDAIIHYLAEEHYNNTPWQEFQENFNRAQTAPRKTAKGNHTSHKK